MRRYFRNVFGTRRDEECSCNVDCICKIRIFSGNSHREYLGESSVTVDCYPRHMDLNIPIIQELAFSDCFSILHSSTDFVREIFTNGKPASRSRRPTFWVSSARLKYRAVLGRTLKICTFQIGMHRCVLTNLYWRSME